MTPASPGSGGPPRRPKATLICQACGRERRVDGGWCRREDGDGVAVVCPECEHVLTRRPGREASRTDGSSPDGAALPSTSLGPPPALRRRLARLRRALGERFRLDGRLHSPGWLGIDRWLRGRDWFGTRDWLRAERWLPGRVGLSLPDWLSSRD